MILVYPFAPRHMALCESEKKGGYYEETCCTSALPHHGSEPRDHGSRGRRKIQRHCHPAHRRRALRRIRRHGLCRRCGVQGRDGADAQLRCSGRLRRRGTGRRDRHAFGRGVSGRYHERDRLRLCHLRQSRVRLQDPTVDQADQAGQVQIPRLQLQIPRQGYVRHRLQAV